jgi:hypothetical protein
MIAPTKNEKEQELRKAVSSVLASIKRLDGISHDARQAFKIVEERAYIGSVWEMAHAFEFVREMQTALQLIVRDCLPHLPGPPEPPIRPQPVLVAIVGGAPAMEEKS